MFDVDGKQDHDQGALHMNGSLQNGLDEKGFRYRYMYSGSGTYSYSGSGTFACLCGSRFWELLRSHVPSLETAQSF